MEYPKISCGGFYLDPATLKVEEQDGKPVLTVVGGATTMQIADAVKAFLQSAEGRALLQSL